ncbi:hypothetical protein E2542_SST18340 [Spatholobus suberectus]|nr:hypothetical protein E2542_SST18340 [Spatholobus suberectus]
MDKKYQGDIKKKFSKFLKRTLQFVFSISVFSLFVWYSSGFSILLQCFSAYFSTCLFSMLTRTLERKYMFLICNGILALLAMSPFDVQFQASTNTKAQVSEEAGFPPGAFRLLENTPLMVEEEEIAQVQAKRQEEYSEQVSEVDHGTDTLFIETEGRVSEASIAEEDVAGKDETGSSGVMVAQDDELVTGTTMETNEEPANTDELNRKIEESIRKMKEEMRINEAQRQPIAV